MKPSRDKNALARQHALNMYRAPKVSRFAVGKILWMFEAGAVRWLNQTLFLHNGSDRHRVYCSTGNSMSPTYDYRDSITGSIYGIMKSVAPLELQRGMFASLA